MKTQNTPKNIGVKKARAPQKAPGLRTHMGTTGDTHDEHNVIMKSLLKEEEEIASRAYKIWQEQGCPEGFDEIHWRLAELEILGVSSGSCAA